ncbi:MAG: hypothetical protein IH946_09205 [Bacteroidetes bacterium]|nr:hypothetical protein [Bacteroidota bacterium]
MKPFLRYHILILAIQVMFWGCERTCPPIIELDFELTDYEKKVIPYEYHDQIMFSTDGGDTVILRNRGRAQYLDRAHISQMSECSSVGVYDLEGDTTTFYNLDTSSILKKIELFIGFTVEYMYSNEVNLELRIKINPWTITSSTFRFDIYDQPKYSELEVNGRIYKEVYYTYHVQDLKDLYYTKENGIIRFAWQGETWYLLE